MQNTMVRGGDGQPGKKMKLGVKNEKGERKKEENYIKKGERGLKNASPRAVILKKKSRGGLPTPPLGS